MKSVIRLLGFWVIGLCVIFLSSYAFAGQVQLEGVVARIPSARILDWEGLVAQVNGEDGWQEQALSVGDEVCCPAGQTADAFVLVALNRSADNLVRLSSGTCITITEDTGSSADAVSQDSGESLFDLSLLAVGSTFTVETPAATIGVSGTAFIIIVEPGRTFVEVLEGNAVVTDKTTDVGEAGTVYDCDEGQTVEIIEAGINPGELLLSSCKKICNDAWKTCKNGCPKGKEGKECREECREDKDDCRALCP